MKYTFAIAASALVLAGCTTDTTTETADAVETTTAASQDLCLASGPQTPRDISSKVGLNMADFPLATEPTKMNLCNIHTHTNAEHKGPGFSVFVDSSDYGGYACNGTADLTDAEKAPLPGAYGKVVPGQTIEVHWVHTSCDAEPGEGLGACVPEGCTDPLLRVEAQTLLVVNDPNAPSFLDMAAYSENSGGFIQASGIPSNTGTPVNFRGSTTGPSYTQSQCSPAQVTWNVRPNCMKVSMQSLHEWAEDNAFNETASHGVRQLVTAPELLSPIE